MEASLVLRSPIPLLALTFAVSIVAASHEPRYDCDSEGAPALGIVEVTTGDPSATFYVDDRGYVNGNGIWVYQESNGVWTSQGPGVHRGHVTDHNLQRGAPCSYVPDDCEPCVDRGDWDPDTLWF